MSPVPLLKSQELMRELNRFIVLDKRDDFHKLYLENEFEKLIEIEPVDAHIGLALIAYKIDKNEKLMRKNFDMVLQYDKNNPIHLLNYSEALYELDCIEEAKNKLQESLRFIDSLPRVLTGIAEIAYKLNCEETFIDIVKKADEYNIYSDIIGFMSAQIMLANCDSEDEEIEVLNQIFSDEYLEKNATPFSDEEWNDIVNLAEELEQYE